jgi:hypothetical protein
MFWIIPQQAMVSVLICTNTQVYEEIFSQGVLSVNLRSSLIVLFHVFLFTTHWESPSMHTEAFTKYVETNFICFWKQ